ncbi:sugar transferase [Mannheimia varigena USDA-ARS-USMARC-1388]|uniref:undecaprenyl-phosphate galactose phosphotransferase WbaP n=1 Tax=Mannheimia varigena TaxID=85404 RepID=UPI0003E3ACC4|nr:undecaprenyl-phosphate galactose phosphotransferase WbaP [Mannheimia varigena]AHG80396.1 sugar transferase [Mannheimia varigena USDA-ARS-USMARC-1388]
MNHQKISKYAMIGMDLFSFCLAFFIVLLLISTSFGELDKYIPLEEMNERALIHFGLALLCVGWFWGRLRHYTYRKPFWFELKEILRTLFIFSVIDLAILSLSKLYVSRYVWLLTWLIILVLFPLSRILLKSCLIRKGWFLKDTVIIGGKINAIDAYNAIINERYLGLNIKYFITDTPDDNLRALGIEILSYKQLDEYWEILGSNTQFMIALEDSENIKRDTWIRNLTKKGYRFISIIPSLRGLPLYSTDMSFLFSYEIILLRINHNLAKRSSKIIKRTMDITLSAILLLLLSPILFAIWLIITCSGGKALYSHTRIGREGKPFQCWKFRSMKKNADELLQTYLDENPQAYEEWHKERKLRRDPRVTKFGYLLRKFSLDELPQLYNVVIGEMSLVGPRPITKDELQYYRSSLDYYFMSKPGMTGLWQVSGRNNVSYDTRVYFDAWYVKNWSVWNDIVILCKTVPAVCKRTGAM